MSTNTNKSDKVYVNAMWFEEKTFDDGGSIIKVNITADDMIKFLKENKNKDGYVKIVVSKRKQVGEKGQTHYAYLDTWQPTIKSTPTVRTPASKPTKTVPVEQEEQLI